MKYAIQIKIKFTQIANYRKPNRVYTGLSKNEKVHYKNSFTKFKICDKCNSNKAICLLNPK